MDDQYTGLLGTIDSELGNLVLGSPEGGGSGGGGPAIYNLSVSNTLTPTQSLSIRFTSGTTFNNLTITQTVTVTNHSKLISQNLPISQTVVVNSEKERFIEHTLVINQNLIRTYDQSTSSTLTPTQSATFLKNKVVTPNNTLTFGQSATLSVEKNRIVVSTLVPTQTVTRNKVNNANPNNTLVVNQSVTVQNTKNASNTLTINHTADITVSKRLVSNLGESLQQFVTVAKELNRQTLSYTVLFQVLQMTKVARRDISHTLTINQSVTVETVKAASNTLNITQTVTGTVSKSTSNLLIINNTVSSNVVLNRSISQSFAPTQLVEFYTVYNRDLTSVLGINHTVSVKRARGLSASNTLILGQELVKSRYFHSPSNTLVLAQTATLQKDRVLRANNTLILSHSVQRNLVINHSVSNTLVFLKQRTINDGETEIVVPDVQIYTVTDYVQLRGRKKTVILPNPEFNDNQGVKTGLQIKQAVGGKKYALVKNNNRTKLEYTFLIDNDDRDNLEEFVYYNYDRYFWLTTFRGEQYYVTLVTNPIEYVQISDHNCGKVSVDLSFEGVLTN